MIPWLSDEWNRFWYSNLGIQYGKTAWRHAWHIRLFARLPNYWWHVRPARRMREIHDRFWCHISIIVFTRPWHFAIKARWVGTNS